MKLAVLLGLALDRRSGRVLESELLPADQAIRSVKEAITAGVAPDPRFPLLMAVAIGGGVLRQHRFDATAEDLAPFEDGTIRDATAEDLAVALEQAEGATDAALEANAGLKADNDALQARIEAAEEKLASIPADVAEAMARIEAIRAKLSGISDKVNKTDILKLVEEALTL